jgi:hypothetical protein
MMALLLLSHYQFGGDESERKGSLGFFLVDLFLVYSMYHIASCGTILKDSLINLQKASGIISLTSRCL